MITAHKGYCLFPLEIYMYCFFQEHPFEDARQLTICYHKPQTQTFRILLY